MALTPEEIEQHTFRERFRGYDPDQVDAFLDRVVAALRTAERERDTARQERDDAVAAREAIEDHSESEELLRKTLLNAQRTAEQTLRDANADGERIRERARDHARRIVADARDQAHAVADAVEELLAAHDRLRQSLREVLEEHAALLHRDDQLPAAGDLVDRLRRIGDQAAAEAEPLEAVAPEAAPPARPDEPVGDDAVAPDRAGDHPAATPPHPGRAAPASEGIGLPQPPPANGEPGDGEAPAPAQPPPARGQ